MEFSSGWRKATSKENQVFPTAIPTYYEVDPNDYKTPAFEARKLGLHGARGLLSSPAPQEASRRASGVTFGVATPLLAKNSKRLDQTGDSWAVLSPRNSQFPWLALWSSSERPTATSEPCLRSEYTNREETAPADSCSTLKTPTSHARFSSSVRLEQTQDFSSDHRRSIRSAQFEPRRPDRKTVSISGLFQTRLFDEAELSDYQEDRDRQCQQTRHSVGRLSQVCCKQNQATGRNVLLSQHAVVV